MSTRYFIALIGIVGCILSATTAHPAEPASKSIGKDETTGGAKVVMVDESAALAHTASIFPVDSHGKIVPAANVAQQVKTIVENLDVTLRKMGSSFDRSVKLNVYLANEGIFPKVREVLSEKFKSRPKPAITYVVSGFPESSTVVAMDVVAVSSLSTKVVTNFLFEDSTHLSMGAVLPAGPKLYISGMADTNSLVPAVGKTLEKLVAALSSLGSAREDIVQLKVFIQPISQASAVDAAIIKFFDKNPPPVVFVDWISANPVVEIELIARARGDFSKEPDTVSYLTPPGTTASKVYSRVARVNRGKLIYLPGFYGNKSIDGAGQVQEIYSALGEMTKETGSDLEHLVKATYYVTDEDASNKLNELRPKYYNPQRPPAASKAKVKGVGVAGKTVTLDMIAVTK